MVTADGNETGYSLPNDLHTVHTVVFGIQNHHVLDNLLGTFYIDQEKGWTLLNHGKATGNNQFTIENLVLGLSDLACDDLEERLTAVKRELKKYKQMFDTAQYQIQLNELGENLVFDNENEELQKKIDILQFDRKPLYEELKRLEKVIKQNSSFKKYTSNMKLFAQAPNGETVPVNEQTLVGFSENMEYIITKRKLVSAELAEPDRKIQSMEKHLQQEGTLFDVKTIIETFDADISKIHIDSRAVDKVIKSLGKEPKRLEELITESIKSNNPIVTELHTLISGYAAELVISEEYVRPNKDYIFTSDLKSLSGAIFHKMVFAFKLAYIQSVFNHTGSRLPVILDSPS